MSVVRLGLRGVRSVITLAAAGLLTLACLGTSPASGGPRRPKPGASPKPESLVAFETLVQRAIPGQQGEQLRQAIRDSAAWKNFWFSLRERGSGVLAPQEPAVDFEKSMVIVAAMPTQGCLSKVTIRGVSHPPGVLVVDLLEEPPAPNCRCLVAQRPLHAVAVPRSEDRVRFVVTQGVTACGGGG